MAQPFALLKRSLCTSPHIIKNVTVIGGGLMGSGIAQVAAQTGHNVVLVDTNTPALDKANQVIHRSLYRVSKKLFKEKPTEGERFVANAVANLTCSLDAQDAVRDSDLVIEAIVENLEVKHKLLMSLDEAAPAKAIFATNTSSLSVAEIASVTNRKNRFGGLHFFNPVPVMKLLEVIRIPDTSDETYDALMAFGRTIGKTCISCKDTPGFVVNRLLIPYIAEAIRMYERGDASARDIDTAMKQGAGVPMGPIELADYVGLDTIGFILDGWHQKFPDNPLFKTSATLQKLICEGKLGVKAGEGFYEYNKK